MNKWGFIYTLENRSSVRRVDVIGSLVCVGIPNIEAGPDAARYLLDEGVELIELCGAFGGAGLGDVVKAVNGRVPVGAIFYGVDASAGLTRLFGKSHA